MAATQKPLPILLFEVDPEQDAVDREIRRSRYEQAEVQHYWIVDPAKQQFEFWQWSPDGHQLGKPDPDGCYRGISDMSFSPEIFWFNMEENQSPYTQKLPAFTSTGQDREWVFRKEPGTELNYGSLPFVPTVGLIPVPISPEQFISWCPKTKLESGPFPLIGEVTFTRPSDMRELEEALGQCVLYSRLLARYDSDRKVYLAVTDEVYESVFEEEAGQILVQDGLLSVVTFDANRRELIRWVP